MYGLVGVVWTLATAVLQNSNIVNIVNDRVPPSQRLIYGTSVDLPWVLFSRPSSHEESILFRVRRLPCTLRGIDDSLHGKEPIAYVCRGLQSAHAPLSLQLSSSGVVLNSQVLPRFRSFLSFGNVFAAQLWASLGGSALARCKCTLAYARRWCFYLQRHVCILFWAG